MRVVLVLVLLGLLVAPADAGFLQNWTISASATDPFVNEGPPTSGVKFLYLWFTGYGFLFECAAAEMGLSTSGTVAVLGVLPINGFAVSGPNDALVIAAPGGCVSGPALVAQILVLDLPGAICFAPSSASGANCTADCHPSQRRYWQNGYVGYSSDGSTPCVGWGVDPCVVPAVGAPEGVDAAAWGRVKASYR